MLNKIGKIHELIFYVWTIKTCVIQCDEQCKVDEGMSFIFPSEALSAIRITGLTLSFTLVTRRENFLRRHTQSPLYSTELKELIMTSDY